MWLIRRFFILAKLNYLCWDSLHKIMRVKLLGIQVNEMWVKKLHIWKEWTKGLYMWKRTIDLMNQCLLSFGSNLANKISLCGFLLVPLKCIGKIWLYVLLRRIWVKPYLAFLFKEKWCCMVFPVISSFPSLILVIEDLKCKCHSGFLPCQVCQWREPCYLFRYITWNKIVDFTYAMVFNGRN